MEIISFREHVRTSAALRQGDLVYNATADHASIIIEHLFASARDRVRILSGELVASIYGNPNIVQRAKEFLGHSDHHLDILVERHTFNKTHPLIEEIGEAENLAISLVKPEVSDRTAYHFMTADDDCYRFEARKNSCVAIAAFGSGAKANPTPRLNSIFAQIAESAEPIDMKAVFR